MCLQLTLERRRGRSNYLWGTEEGYFRGQELKIWRSGHQKSFLLVLSWKNGMGEAAWLRKSVWWWVKSVWWWVTVYTDWSNLGTARNLSRAGFVACGVSWPLPDPCVVPALGGILGPMGRDLCFLLARHCCWAARLSILSRYLVLLLIAFVMWCCAQSLPHTDHQSSQPSGVSSLFNWM